MGKYRARINNCFPPVSKTFTVNEAIIVLRMESMFFESSMTLPGRCEVSSAVSTSCRLQVFMTFGAEPASNLSSTVPPIRCVMLSLWIHFSPLAPCFKRYRSYEDLEFKPRGLLICKVLNTRRHAGFWS